MPERFKSVEVFDAVEYLDHRGSKKLRIGRKNESRLHLTRTTPNDRTHRFLKVRITVEEVENV